MTQEWPSDKHLLKAYVLLGKLQVGEALKIEDHAPNKPDLFIKCCELYQSIYNNLKISEDKTHITKTLNFKDLINENFKP